MGSPSKKKIGHSYSSSNNISEVYNISNSSNNISGINGTQNALAVDFSVYKVDTDAAATATAVADDNDNGRGLSCVRVFTKTTIKKKRKHTEKGYTKEQKQRWNKMFKQLVKYK